MQWVLGAILCGVAGLLLLLLSSSLRARAGLPHGEVIYSDTADWRRCEKTLFSARCALAGRPDYVVLERKGYVPIEVKPGRVFAQPQWSDVLQLAAYCCLVEDEYGRRPPHGYLKYRDRLFRIAYDRRLEKALLTVIEQMRGDLHAPDVAASHNEPQRCMHCGYRAACDQRLA